MSIQQALHAQENDQDQKHYQLVVVGAGIAGLNAIDAARDYLPKGAPVLLLDQKDDAGGMWHTAYDYVRLHQPHPMFTVGDSNWGWNKPRSYLAKRDEIQAHLAKSLGRSRDHFNLTTGFGQTVASCREVDTEQGPKAKVTFHPNGDPSKQTTVLADRAIFASGLNYKVAEPLKFASDAVVSIIPQDLLRTLEANPTAPVVVVGGGRTGMDTILAAFGQNPQRSVTLIKGRGTNFMNRTKYLPTGLKRWTSGELLSRIFRDVALAFDGENEDATIVHFRKNHSTTPDDPNGVFLFGLQSEDENQRVRDGLQASLPSYLLDVEEGPKGPEMVLKDGTRCAVKEGTIFVNCTGSFFRTEEMAAEMPVISPNRVIFSINPREGFHFLTSVTGFFGTHLLYRDLLWGRGFYALDHEGLFRKNRNAWVGAAAAQAYMNQVVAVQNLPLMLLDRCGLDLDRWYPFHRRMIGLLRMKATATSDIAHCRATLDRVAERFDVRSGEIQ